MNKTLILFSREDSFLEILTFFHTAGSRVTENDEGSNKVESLRKKNLLYRDMNSVRLRTCPPLHTGKQETSATCQGMEEELICMLT